MSSSQVIPAIDSLQSLLIKAKEDTNKVSILNSLSSELINKIPAKALSYAFQAAKLAERIGWQKGLAYSYRNIGSSYLSLSDPSKAIDFHQKSLFIAKKLGDKNLQAREYGNIGNAYNAISNYNQALDQYQKAVDILDTLGADIQFQTTLMISIGNVYLKLANYSVAIGYFQQAEELASKNGFIDRQVFALNNISTTYISLREYSKSIEYSKKSLELSQKNGLTINVAASLGNIGQAYQLLKDDSTALLYYQKSLNVAQQINDYTNILPSLSNIGSVYNDWGDYGLALEYYYKALRLSTSGVAWGIYHEAKILNRIGYTYFKMSEYKKAIVTVRNSLEKSLSTNNVEAQRDNWQLLQIIYDTIKQSDSAYFAYKKYIIFRDSIFDVEQQKAILKNEMQFEFEKKQQKEQEQEEKLKREVNKEIFYKRIMLTTSLMFLVWLSIIYYLLRIKRANRFLRIRNNFAKLFEKSNAKIILLICIHILLFIFFKIIFYEKENEFESNFYELINILVTLLAAMFFKVSE